MNDSKQRGQIGTDGVVDRTVKIAYHNITGSPRYWKRQYC
eukprot:COSAG03_NODE_9161_length_742_cov_0.654743_2_plen_39_part_01